MLNSRDQILPVRPDSIPTELKQLRRWAIWIAERKSPDTPKLDKVPRQALNPSRKAKSNDPTTWCSFEEALAAYEARATTGADGLLIATGGGLAGVDLDTVVDPSTGELTDEARAVLATLNTYAELSVSGTGARCFAFGPPDDCVRFKEVEVYAKSQFLSVTGHHLEGSPLTVEQRDAELDSLRNQLREQKAASRPRRQRRAASGGAGQQQQPANDGSCLGISDEMIIATGKAIVRGFEAVWEGDDSAYGGDRSRADMALFGALAYLLGPGQEARVEAIARQSALVREKWDRRDYIEGTIRQAYEGREDFYRWSGWNGGRVSVPIILQSATLADPNAPVAYGRVDLGDPVTLNDIGFAKRLAAEAMDRVRYAWEWEKWLRWDGRRWEIDDGAAIMREAMDLERRLWQEFAALDRAKQSGEVIKYLRSCGGAARLNAGVGLASTQECIRVGLRSLDQHCYLLNVRNGTLDLDTGILRPHNPADLITQVADVEFLPGNGSGLWERFISDAMSGDEERVRFLQASAGLALSGDVSEQLLWCHYGRGCNGKSTLLTAIRKMLGDYGGDAPPDFLMMKKNDSHPTEVAAMYGKRFVTAIECEAGRRLREAFVKLITGGDPLATRRMKEDYWTVHPTWKIHAAFNDPPVLSGTDDGIRRRLKIIPWRENFDGPRRDKTIKARLESEECRSEILNWCLRGYQDWRQSGGIPAASAVSEATGEYVAEQDIFGQFIAEECVTGDREQVLFENFMSSFKCWLERNGEHGDSWTSKRVGSELQRRGYQKFRLSTAQYRGRAAYRGLTRREDAGPSFTGMHPM